MKKQSKTNLAQIDAMKDEEVDTSDIPPLTKEFFKKATLRLPTRKETITIRVDADVLSWFKRQGKGYQSRMNAVLKMFVEAQKAQKT
ncbi:MAG: BrnA antitoxin family protein [Acidobacteria bacterium]|nr:BrnA antitoxin family protein [Acidobacteriota bacterium]